MVRRTFVALVAGLVLVGCAGEVEPIGVPDLAGLALIDAREMAEGLDLELDEVDGSGRDRSVFSPGNWSVVMQDPSAGTAVEPESIVVVTLENERDQEPEPEPDDEPEDTDEPEDEPERSTSLEADVSAGAGGLRIVTEDDVTACRVNLNGGLIRSGFTTRIANITAGDPVVVPWGELTNRDGERFDYGRLRPEMVTIDCEDPDGGLLVDTWNW
jgi:hypothetical protein